MTWKVTEARGLADISGEGEGCKEAWGPGYA